MVARHPSQKKVREIHTDNKMLRRNAKTENGTNNSKRRGRKRKHSNDAIRSCSKSTVRGLKSKREFIAPYDVLSLIKSPMDTNSYRIIRFPNKLKVCLISTNCHSTTPSNSLRSIHPKTHSTMEVNLFNNQFIGIGRNTSSGLDPECMSLLEKVINYPWVCSADDMADYDSDIEDTCSSPSWYLQSKVRKMEEEVFTVIDSHPLENKHFGIAVCMSVGSLHDPKKFPGMAHLCEHCIFEGTKKYPNAFEILQENCQVVNAFTEKERTVYYATTESLDKFKIILSVFSDMFKFPTLSKGIIEREILSVDSETSLRQTNDVIRLCDLFTSLTTCAHPLGRYHAGDRSTLKQPKQALLSSIRKWFKKYYHPNNMNISIQGPIQMPQLIRLASEHFSDMAFRRKITCVSPKNQILSFGFPFHHQRFNKLYKINPFEDLQWLVISWVIPGDDWRDHATKPLQYLTHLFNQRGRNSLYEYLRNQGFLIDFKCCSPNPSNSYVKSCLYSTFALLLELTDAGFANAYQIILAIYSYIKTLDKIGPKRRFFNEMRQNCANIFHYDRAGSTDFTNIAISVHTNEDNPSLAITVPSLITKYQPDLIRKYITALTPSNMNIMMVSKHFEGEVTHTHPNILTEYSPFYINPDLLKEIELIHHSTFSYFDYPPPNLYIVEDICCPIEQVGKFDRGMKMRAEKSISYLHTTGKASVMCNHEETPSGVPPTAIYTFMINSSFSPVTCAPNSAMMNLWVELFNHHIETKHYDALSAGIEYGSSTTDSGIFLYLQGLSRFLPDISLSVLDEFLNFKVDCKQFEDHKSWLWKVYGNNCLDNMTLAQDLLLYITTCHHFPLLSLQHTLESISYQDLENYMKSFKHQMWICGQLFGCVTSPQLEIIADRIASIPYDTIGVELFEDVCVNNSCIIPRGEKCLRIRSISEKCPTSFVLNYYQLGTIEKENQAVCYFVLNSIANYIFNQLRTKEQLGYLVWTSYADTYGISSFQVCINFQADRFTPGYVDERINACFHLFYKDYLQSNITLKKLFKKFQTQHGSKSNPSTNMACSRKLFTGDNTAEPDAKFYYKNLKNVKENADKTKEMLHLDKIRLFYKAHFPYKLSNEGGGNRHIRKLSIQVKGYKRDVKSSPKEPQFEGLLRTIYAGEIICDAEKDVEGTTTEANEINLRQLKYDFPTDLTDENGYFINNLLKFKNQLFLYPNKVRTNPD